MNNDQTVAIYGITPETRLHLKLLAAASGKTMAEAITGLVEDAYNVGRVTSDDKRRKVKRIIKGWIRSPHIYQ
jgi:hypothetical protein